MLHSPSKSILYLKTHNCRAWTRAKKVWHASGIVSYNSLCLAHLLRLAALWKYARARDRFDMLSHSYPVSNGLLLNKVSLIEARQHIFSFPTLWGPPTSKSTPCHTWHLILQHRPFSPRSKAPTYHPHSTMAKPRGSTTPKLFIQLRRDPMSSLRGLFTNQVVKQGRPNLRSAPKTEAWGIQAKDLELTQGRPLFPGLQHTQACTHRLTHMITPNLCEKPDELLESGRHLPT